MWIMKEIQSTYTCKLPDLKFNKKIGRANLFNSLTNSEIHYSDENGMSILYQLLTKNQT